MKRIYPALLPVLFLCTFFRIAFLEAQTTAIGWVAGITTTTYRFDEPTHYPGTSNAITWKGEYANANYMLGADVIRQVSRHIQLKTGLHLTASSYTQSFDGEGSTVQETGVYLPVYDHLTIRHFLAEIPLVVRYVMPLKRWVPYAEAGLSANSYLFSWVSQRDAAGRYSTLRRQQIVHPVNLSMQLAAGFQIRSLQKSSWFFQGGLSKQLTRVQKNAGNPLVDMIGQVGWRKWLN